MCFIETNGMRKTCFLFISHQYYISFIVQQYHTKHYSIKFSNQISQSYLKNTGKRNTIYGQSPHHSPTKHTILDTERHKFQKKMHILQLYSCQFIAIIHGMTVSLEFRALEIEIPHNLVFIPTQGCHSMVLNQWLNIFQPFVSLKVTDNPKFTKCIEFHKD